MYGRLGHFVSRNWLWVLLFWVAAVVVLRNTTPPVKSVTEPGEFNFLPDSAPTRLGEKLFQQAFPKDLLGSSIVIVLASNNDQKMTTEDFTFIEDVLKPRLQSLMPPTAEDRELSENTPEQAAEKAEADQKQAVTYPEITSVRTPGSREIGKLLISRDDQAALVIVDLNMDFMGQEIRRPVAAVEEVMKSLEKEGLFPKDLKYAYSGSALVGRDMGEAQERSADAVKNWTLILIVVLLFMVYRAPLPVLVPLATLTVALEVSMSLLAAAAQAKWIGMFEGIQVYTVVVAYGAGVDFSMFLTSRFHEEIQRRGTVEEAVTRTMEGVGPAVTAAAGTVIFGIGMMIFATFGKFHQAGISIAFSLFVIWCAAMTFTPAILRVMGRYTFWPEMPQHGVEFRTQKVGPFSQFIRRITFHSESHKFWETLADRITRYPVRAWVGTVLCMLPFSIVGWWCYDHVSYGLIGELRNNVPSVVGTELVSHYFSKGLTGPTTLVIEQPDIDFGSSAGQSLIRELTDDLRKNQRELHIDDIRSVVRPLGEHHEFAQAPQASGVLGRIVRRNAQRTGAAEYYLGGKTETGSHVTRVDLVLDGDPFSRHSIDKIRSLQSYLEANMPEQLKQGKFYLIGSTASIRDLQVIAGSDRVRIIVLVTLAVFVVLLILIRSPADSVYLMATVIFSFLCTLGVAYLVFLALDPDDFGGLDWTVPTFLFTILVAVGQDYNIFLVTRVHEERENHGPVGSVKHAIVQTASIITSCGLIMAGTFCSLVVGGELARMNQLGFSLAFGVLLDTMIVRPILVPAYLAWRARRKEASDPAGDHRP
ncbi:MMPL family transporter [Planctomicrobium sp. SH661]|uniref:MMPL family transporter n=1 Tax=Planctomicrobium sp. SH661 TaxID=3448124 RepID=UPI003F5C36F0